VSQPEPKIVDDPERLERFTLRPGPAVKATRDTEYEPWSIKPDEDAEESEKEAE
jgi:hypothetical protein